MMAGTHVYSIAHFKTFGTKKMTTERIVGTEKITTERIPQCFGTENVDTERMKKYIVQILARKK